MTGKTHYKLGFLYYIIIASLSSFTIMKFIDIKFSLLGVLVAIIASLLPDADTRYSKINEYNPLAKAATTTASFIEKLVIKVVYFIIFIGFSYVLFTNSTEIISFISFITTKENATILTYSSILLIMFLGIFGSSFIMKIPFINGVGIIINKISEKIQGLLVRLTYFFIATLLIIKGENALESYLWAFIFICIGLFPHRSFTHSPEGFLLITGAFNYLAHLINLDYLGIAFFIGYFSHLYLADVFTNSGVPLSFLPYLLEKVHIHDKLKVNPTYTRIYKILNHRLRLPLMSTNTKGGNIFEFFYVVSLVCLLVLIYIKCPISIKLY